MSGSQPALRMGEPLKNRKYRWLMLPIETKFRELDGKLLLAAVAAERGWAVIIGHKDDLAADTENIRGVVLEKDGHIGNDRIRSYLSTGKLVCAMDEEGLVYLNSEDYYRRRLSEGSLQRLALFCLWGEKQKHDILKHMQGMEDKLVLTGSPRFDLLRSGLRNFYASEARRLKNGFGPFLLINTNFADSNHFMGTEWVIENHRKNGFITNASQEADERAFIAYQASIVDRFVEMAGELSLHYPEHTVVVRPHPSENHRRWDAVARAYRNMKVVYKGDVNPWLLAADIAIHNSCMTGIHGFLLEKPTMAYMPVKSDRFDYYLPNALSTRTDTLEGLFSVVDHFRRDQYSIDPVMQNAQMKIAEQYITGTVGPLASDRILEALGRLNIEPDAYTGATSGKKSNRGDRRQPAGRPSLARRIAGKIAANNPIGWLRGTERKHLAYSKQKYPGMTLAEIEGKMSILRKVTGRFGALQVWQHGDQSFCIVSQ